MQVAKDPISGEHVTAVEYAREHGQLPSGSRPPMLCVGVLGDGSACLAATVFVRAAKNGRKAHFRPRNAHRATDCDEGTGPAGPPRTVGVVESEHLVPALRAVDTAVLVVDVDHLDQDLAERPSPRREDLNKPGRRARRHTRSLGERQRQANQTAKTVAVLESWRAGRLSPRQRISVRGLPQGTVDSLFCPISELADPPDPQVGAYYGRIVRAYPLKEHPRPDGSIEIWHATLCVLGVGTRPHEPARARVRIAADIARHLELTTPAHAARLQGWDILVFGTAKLGKAWINIDPLGVGHIALAPPAPWKVGPDRKR